MIKDIFYLFFPKMCSCCHEPLVQSEKEICISCRFQLPTTEFTDERDNQVERAFYGRIKIEFATALLFYRKKGLSQKLIFQLKYKGRQGIGDLLGNWLGSQLKESKRLPKVDYIVPVPLHPKKLKKRGYNQLTTFGKSISKILDAPFITDVLIKKSASETQTLKRRFDRWNNVNEIFYITNQVIFKNKHVLLIDDVITTGATLESCALQLSKTENIKISIATMAYTE
jgi:ComF family protein